MSSSIPSWQILTAHAQPFRTRDLAFCLKVPLDSLFVSASSEGSGETARMRRLAWTFAARTGDKYQIRLSRSNYVNVWNDARVVYIKCKPEVLGINLWSSLHGFPYGRIPMESIIIRFFFFFFFLSPSDKKASRIETTGKNHTSCRSRLYRYERHGKPRQYTMHVSFIHCLLSKWDMLGWRVGVQGLIEGNKSARWYIFIDPY